jgi:hypothetical protein
MANLKLNPVNPSVSPIAKPATPGIPKAAKIAKPAKLSKVALSPLFGQRRPRPTVQSTPTRTPSF